MVKCLLLLFHIVTHHGFSSLSQKEACIFLSRELRLWKEHLVKCVKSWFLQHNFDFHCKCGNDELHNICWFSPYVPTVPSLSCILFVFFDSTHMPWLWSPVCPILIFFLCSLLCITLQMPQVKSKLRSKWLVVLSWFVGGSWLYCIVSPRPRCTQILYIVKIPNV
jgi:hypothetical protein